MLENQMAKVITLETLEHQLQTHDWTFNYSDDPKFYKAGSQQQKQIKQQVEKLYEMGLTKKVNELFYSHYPSDGCDIPAYYGITKEWRDHLEEQLFDSLDQNKFYRVQ
jgi:hypothetical protein